MMSECAIAHIRAFRQEFTINDLVYATEKVAHVAEAVETGGLAFKGKPTKVYEQWVDDAEASCKKLLQTRAKVQTQHQVDPRPFAKVDYSQPNVAEQCWKMVSRHFKEVFKASGVAECIHKTLFEHEADPPPLKKVSFESLGHFAADIAVLLRVQSEGAPDENVDADADPTLPSGCGAAVPLVNLAQLAQQMPLSEAQGLMAAEAELEVEPPLSEFLPGAAEGEPQLQHPSKSEIQKLVWTFVHPTSHLDVVDSAIKLSTEAMYSRSVSASLPDRRHGSIEQRWMAIDKCLGPMGAAQTDTDVVQRDDVVQHADAYWRVCACFGKYYGRWSLLTDPAAFKDNFHLLLQRLYVDKACKPYVVLNVHMSPMAVIASGSSCKSAGYSLLSCGDAPAKAKKMKTVIDMWA